MKRESKNSRCREKSCRGFMQQVRPVSRIFGEGARAQARVFALTSWTMFNKQQLMSGVSLKQRYRCQGSATSFVHAPSLPTPSSFVALAPRSNSNYHLLLFLLSSRLCCLSVCRFLYDVIFPSIWTSQGSMYVNLDKLFSYHVSVICLRSIASNKIRNNRFLKFRNTKFCPLYRSSVV